jgi:hypothetical protein
MPAPRKAKTRPTQDLAPLPPEAAAALQSQVAALAAACESGQDLESLQDLVSANSEDLRWDLHLMASLGNILHPLIPPLLATRFGSSPDKARRKALKRVLYLLKARGVPVSGDLLPREEPAFGPLRPPAVQSKLSPILGNGDAYLVLEGPKEILGGNLLVATINDTTGLQECHLLNLKSRQQTEFWDHYRQHGLTDWFPVPGPYAVRLLEEAYQAKTAVIPAKNTYGSLRDKIWKNWGRPEAAPDLEQVLPVIDSAERRRLLEHSRQLAANPLFQTWMPSLEELTPWVEKLQEIQQSPLVLSEPQKQARGDALVDEATLVLYPPEARPLWRRRLLAMAYCLDLGQHPEEARLARAAADDLGDLERSAVAGENPFLKSLVQAALRLAWDQVQKTQEAQSASGLLTLPGAPHLTRR